MNKGKHLKILIHRLFYLPLYFYYFFNTPNPITLIIFKIRVR